MIRHRFVVAIILGLLLGGCGVGGADNEGTTAGKRLPDAAFVTLAGDTIRISEMVGQPLIINFWATWCGPCKQEIPLLQEAYTNHRADGLRLIAVTDETKDIVQPFMQDLGMSFPVMFDEGGRASNAYQIQGIPTTFFLDRDGMIIARHVGALSPTNLRSYLEDMLRPAPGTSAPTTQPAQPTPTVPLAPTNAPAPSPLPIRDQVGAQRVAPVASQSEAFLMEKWTQHAAPLLRLPPSSLILPPHPLAAFPAALFD